MQNLIPEIDLWWTANSLSRTSTVVVALSGGRDSMLLLHILQSLSTVGNIGPVSAAWFDHGLRSKEEIEVENKLVHTVCDRLKVSLRCGSADDMVMQSLIQTSGLEAAARQLRYQFLLDCVRQQTESSNVLLATAHHLDDQKETLLMRVGSGSGLAGLAAIAPVRKLHSGCLLVRPLLTIAGSRIAEAAQQIDLQYHTDSSNSDTDILRNRIRAQIVPHMDSVFPQFDLAASRITKDAGDVSGWLFRLLPVLLHEETLPLGQGVRICTREFLDLPGALRVQYLLQLYNFFLDTADFSSHRTSRKSFRILEQLNDSCLSSVAGTRLYTDSVYEVFLDSEHLVIISSPFLHRKWSVILSTPTDVNMEPNYLKLPNGVVFRLDTACIPPIFPCVARSILPGDTAPDGKSLKRWFQRRSIPEYQRPGYAIMEHPKQGIFAILDPSGDIQLLQQ